MLHIAVALVIASSPATAKAAKPKTSVAAEAAVPAPEPPPESSTTGRRRAVVLTPQQLSRPIGVRGAPNVATMLSFPEPWAAPPSCGDCIVGGQEPAGGAQPSTLWRIDIFDQTNTIAVKPIAFPGPDLPLTAFEASLDVTLAGGTAVTLFLTLAEVPANADLRIDFQLPEGADAKSRGTALERELRNEFDARLDVAVKEALAETMMAGTKCKDFSGGPRRKDELITRVRQMCRNGSYLYVVFEVENGSRKDLSLASAVLAGQEAGESDFYRFKKDRLLFRERTLGFAALPSVDLNTPSSSYTLTITEDGGSQRALTIEDIEF